MKFLVIERPFKQLYSIFGLRGAGVITFLSYVLEARLSLSFDSARRIYNQEDF